MNRTPPASEKNLEVTAQQSRARDRRRSWLLWYFGCTIVFLVLLVAIG